VLPNDAAKDDPAEANRHQKNDQAVQGKGKGRHDDGERERTGTRAGDVKGRLANRTWFQLAGGVATLQGSWDVRRQFPAAMKRIFLTGGAGFIGCNVVAQLLEEGHEVAIYDSFINYVFPLNRTHIDNIDTRLRLIQDRIKIYRGSTQDQDCLRRAVADFRPQRIIHLAAMPLANLAVEHPEEAVQAILLGTLSLLQAARDLPGFERLVYVSSSMVYGDFVRTPIQEDDRKEPKELYGAMKLSGELLVRSFGSLFGIDCAIVRPSAVYGPTDNNRRVLGVFLEQALLSKPLQVRGSANTLDFTYVGDAARGVICATLHPAASGRAFNITRGRARGILEAAQIIAKLVPGTKIEVIEHDRRMPVRGALDISRASEEIGFIPRVDIEEGLERYLAHLLEQRRRGIW
jgi:nucleoside-diphosphate-sugar epimerase